jgi:anti-sigma B factor antagonist
MSLSIDARHCGAVYVIKCSGRIVAGDESRVLEAAIGRGLLEFRRLIVDLGGVTRLDSGGIGLLVRYLSHTRSRGGDLRLSTAPPFLADLLRATKLTTVFKIYDSEEEAIVSFLKEPTVPDSEETPAGPQVLFVDRSPDVCALVRVLLAKSGYSGLSTCRVHDAKLLLLSGKFDYLVLGSEFSEGESAAAVDKLKAVAGLALIVQLSISFNHNDPEQAGLELLGLMTSARSARGAGVA